MKQEPTRSTLFPYTTLFRSRIGAEVADVDAVGDHAAGGGLHRAGLVHRQIGVLRLGHRGGAQQAQQRTATSNPDVDRKSTRLNSSHSSISYAVFCLKKKTNQ